MKGTVLHGPGDIRFEEVPEPKIEKPTRCDHPHRCNLRVWL
jgi:hypothetical protein